MKTTITNTILRHISKEILVGRPIWALLRLNEYLSSDSPLHKAFQKKAKDQLRDSQLNPKLQRTLQKVIHGARLIDLSEREKQMVIAYRESASQPYYSRKIPQFIYDRSKLSIDSVRKTIRS